MARRGGFLWAADGAASPVVGVIMMVGTTVILGASVYAWTSAYADVPDQGVKVLALASEGPVEDGVKRYVVAASMPGLRYAHLDLALDEDRLERRTQGGACAAPAEGTFVVCRDGEVVGRRETALPGDRVLVAAQAEQTLRVIDAEARFVILTLTVA